jgi:hypothetical protein
VSNDNLQIHVTGSLPKPSIQIVPAAFEARRVALERSGNCKAITDVVSLEEAANALTVVKSLARSVEDSRKDVKAPVLEVGRQIDAVAKDYLSPLEAEAARLSTLVGTYQEAQRRKAEKAREEEARKQAEAVAEMQRKQAAALAEGDEAAADAARAEAADKIAESQLALEQAEGPKPTGIVTKTAWKFEVTDIAALYAARPELVVLSPNNAAIRAVVKASNGKPLPGVRCWQEAGAIVRGGAPVNVEEYDY